MKKILSENAIHDPAALKFHYCLKEKMSQKRFLTEKIRPVMPVLPIHAGNRKKTNKMIITGFLVKFYFIQN